MGFLLEESPFFRPCTFRINIETKRQVNRIIYIDGHLGVCTNKLQWGTIK